MSSSSSYSLGVQGLPHTPQHYTGPHLLDASHFSSNGHLSFSAQPLNVGFSMPSSASSPSFGSRWNLGVLPSLTSSEGTFGLQSSSEFMKGFNTVPTAPLKVNVNYKANEAGLHALNNALGKMCHEKQEKLDDLHNKHKASLEKLYGTGLELESEVVIDAVIGTTALNPVAAVVAGHVINKGISPALNGIKDQMVQFSMPPKANLYCK